MFFDNVIYKSGMTVFALLLSVQILCSRGYIFLKKEGIPERLIPQDCPANKTPEAIELTPTQAHLYVLQNTYREAYLPSGMPCSCSGPISYDSYGGHYEKLSWTDEHGEGFKIKIEPYLDIIEQVIKNEQKYSQSHYMFYHAQSGSFRFLQDFLKDFYALLNIQASYSNFEFLRAFHEAVPKADVNQFLDDESDTIRNNYDFDYLLEIKNKLLSVNLALFGNEKKPGECTFSYFQNGRSNEPFNIDWISKGIEKILAVELTRNEYELLQEIYSKVDSGGALFQICVPQNLVDKCVYLSRPKGRPYEQKLINKCYSLSKNRHIRISDILNKYIQPDFLDFDRLDELQARIFFSQDIMLSPNSGVKLFRFTHSDNQDKYGEGLRRFVHIVATRYLAETDIFDKKNNTPFNRLAAMIFNK